MADLIERLRDAAADAAAEEYGVSGLLAEADAEIERLRAEREVIGAEAVKYAGKSGRLEAKVERLAEALKQARESIEEWAYFANSCGGEIVGLQEELSEIDLILHDHDQEDRNG